MIDTEQQAYRLKDGIDSVVRSGIVLEADETIEAYPDVLDRHDDVLEPVADVPERRDDTDQPDADNQEDPNA